MEHIQLSPRRPTVKQLVLESPARARAFEKHDISYCCHGGGKTLEEACRDSGAEPQALQRDLQEIDELSTLKAQGLSWGELALNIPLRQGEVPDWSAAPVNEVAEHVLQIHHEWAQSELPRLTRLVAGIVASHGPQFHNIGEVQFVLQGLRACLEAHMVREEELLSGLEAPGPKKARFAHDVLSNEHQEIARSATKLRQLTNGFCTPPGACVTFRVTMEALADFEADLHHQISEETQTLFSRFNESSGAAFYATLKN